LHTVTGAERGGRHGLSASCVLVPKPTNVANRSATFGSSSVCGVLVRLLAKAAHRSGKRNQGGIVRLLRRVRPTHSRRQAGWRRYIHLFDQQRTDDAVRQAMAEGTA